MSLGTVFCLNEFQNLRVFGWDKRKPEVKSNIDCYCLGLYLGIVMVTFDCQLERTEKPLGVSVRVFPEMTDHESLMHWLFGGGGPGGERKSLGSCPGWLYLALGLPCHGSALLPVSHEVSCSHTHPPRWMATSEPKLWAKMSLPPLGCFCQVLCQSNEKCSE
jgi:hypothetical protein